MTGKLALAAFIIAMLLSCVWLGILPLIVLAALFIAWAAPFPESDDGDDA